MISEAKDPVPPNYLMSMNSLHEAPSSHCESEQLMCNQPVVNQPVIASNSQSNVKHGEGNVRSEISSNQSNAKHTEITKARRNKDTRSKSTTVETPSKTRSGRTVRKSEKLNL